MFQNQVPEGDLTLHTPRPTKETNQLLLNAKKVKTHRSSNLMRRPEIPPETLDKLNSNDQINVNTLQRY